MENQISLTKWEKRFPNLPVKVIQVKVILVVQLKKVNKNCN